MNKCKSYKCQNLLANGDDLFCIFHRSAWRKYCKRLGLNEYSREEDVLGHLDYFALKSKV